MVNDDLYLKICDIENIYNAYLKARYCKRYKEEILKFSYKIEGKLQNIWYELKNKKYRHGLYYKFIVNDSKKRIIRAAPFKDRVVHHSLCNIIGPIFEKFFIYDSYACREYKGSHRAIKRFKQFLRTIKLKNNLSNYNNIYCLKCDIVKYFDSVDTDILLKLIKRRIHNDDVLELVQIILNSYGKGLPIGNLTSQLFANIYLNELDFYIKNVLKVKYYVRYMDDFVLLGIDKKDLWNKYQLVKTFVYKNLKLVIDDNKTKLEPIRRGIVFLGFKIFCKKILLKKETIKRFNRKIKKQLAKIEGDNVQKMFFVAYKFKNWSAYYKKADSNFFVKRFYCKIVSKYIPDIWEFANRD